MLSRAVLPLLRQRSLIGSSRFAFLPSQARLYAKSRKGDDYNIPESARREEWRAPEQEQRKNRYSSDGPLRSIRSNPSERINPRPTEHPSSLGDPTSAPIRHETLSVNSPHDAASRSDASQMDGSPATSDLKPDMSKRSAPETEPEIEEQPSQPLPDLTKGIPSTLAAELGQKEKDHSAPEGKANITEDPERPPPGPGGRGGLPKSEYVSSSDRKRSTAARVIGLSFLLGIPAYLLYLGRDWDTEEEARQHADAPNGYSLTAMYNKMQARFDTTVDYYSKPVVTQLLPDPPTDPGQQRPFVLVLSLEDLLVRSEWNRQTGYRIAKRPGLDYFIQYLSQYYELVLFTSQPFYIGDQVWKKMDPYRLIAPLYREHTVYTDGGYIKDLSYLNRDLKKVVIIDTDPHHVKKQPENAIVLPKWNGDPNDQTLIQLIPFLEYLARMGFDDTRPVLKSFEGTYIPAEFSRREQLLRQKFAKEQGKSKSGKGFGFGSLLNAGSNASGGMIWDQIREEGQRGYQDIHKQIQEDGPKWLAELEAFEKEAQEEAMQSMKSGLFGWFGSSSPSTQNQNPK